MNIWFSAMMPRIISSESQRWKLTRKNIWNSRHFQNRFTEIKTNVWKERRDKQHILKQHYRLDLVEIKGCTHTHALTYLVVNIWRLNELIHWYKEVPWHFGNYILTTMDNTSMYQQCDFIRKCISSIDGSFWNGLNNGKSLLIRVNEKQHYSWLPSLQRLVKTVWLHGEIMNKTTKWTFIRTDSEYMLRRICDDCLLLFQREEQEDGYKAVELDERGARYKEINI